MIGLDLIGSGPGLASQLLLVRVRKIDSAKLQSAAAGDKWYGVAVAPALALADQFPAQALDALAPVVQQQLAGYGITADVAVGNATARPPAETKTAAAGGILLGILIAIGARWAYHRVKGA